MQTSLQTVAESPLGLFLEILEVVKSNIGDRKVRPRNGLPVLKEGETLKKVEQ